MNQWSFEYGTRTIAFDLRRSDRTTLDIAVTPEARVIVTAPRDAAVEDILEGVRRRAGWITRQQRYFDQFRPRTPPRQWVPGETHRYLGRQYRLRIGDDAASAQKVRLTRGFLLIDGVAFDDSNGIERVIRGWMRERIRIAVDRRLPLCAARFGTPIEPTTVLVRSMRTRWASMSSGGRLSINPTLVRAPIDAIDYVLTHELAHLLVPDHGTSFIALMDAVMPDHARRKALLERATS